MDPVVPSDVIVDLVQILGNLMLSDNTIRSDAEKAINDRLAQTPDVYLLGLAQMAISAETDVMRSFSLVLLRRFLLRPLLSESQAISTLSWRAPRATLSDNLSSDTLSTIQRLLLHSFSHEPYLNVRHASVEAIMALANDLMQKDRPWNELQEQAFNMTQNPNAALRESAFRLLAGTRMLGMGGWQMDIVLKVLKGGLEDSESIDVRHSSLRASAALLLSSDEHQLAPSASLLSSMLDTLPSVPQSQFPQFISSLNRLALDKPALFQPHFQPLLSFLGPQILPNTDGASTPTESMPASTHSSTKSKSSREDTDGLDEEKEAAMKAALEFMITLSEAGSGIVNEVDGWVAAIVRGCLEGMGKLRDDDLDEWLDADAIDNVMDDSYARVCEHTLRRLAAAAKKPLLSHAFAYIPSMVANYDWRLKHAGLAAIAQVVVVTWSLTINHDDLGKVIEMVTPLFNDSHPRVRYAACRFVEEICSDVRKIPQQTYGRQLFVLLIPMLDAPEPRVQSQAAAALVKLCDGINPGELNPYLDAIVERLLRSLNPTGNNVKEPKRYVQEQNISAITTVVKESRAMFAKYYSSVMPLLLNALRNATGADALKLRAKVMECAGLLAAAVGPDAFRPDASTLAELLMQIQNDSVDPMLNDQLILTWAKICEAMGTEFEPYLAVVMPPLIEVLAADETKTTDWGFLLRYAQHVARHTTMPDEKGQALESLFVYCSTFQARFAPYLLQSLELTLSLLSVRHLSGEVGTSLIPMLLTCGKESNTLTIQMVSATFHQLTNLIRPETEPTLLLSLLKLFIRCARIVGGPTAVPREALDSLVESLTQYLHNLTEKRKNRPPIPEMPFDIANFGTDFDMPDLTFPKLDTDNFVIPTLDVDEMNEDMETLALTEMALLLSYLDPTHPLLAMVSSVKYLGRNRGMKRADDMMANVMVVMEKLRARFNIDIPLETEEETQ